MARSGYIYVVTDARRELLATFTVKHELLTWIGRQDSVLGYHFWRLADNPVDPALAERLRMTPNLPRELSLEDLQSGRQIR